MKYNLKKSTLIGAVIIFVIVFAIFLVTTYLSYRRTESLDLTFGIDGIVLTNTGASNDYGTSVVLQNDGKIVVAGVSSNRGHDDFSLIRLNSNGSFDKTFGVEGKVITTFSENDDNGHSLALQRDGKIIVAGWSYNNIDSTSDFAIVRYNSNGSIDKSFGVEGKVVTPIGTADDKGYSVAIQNDGKIVVAGYCSSRNVNSCDFAIVRYNSNGILDNTFGVEGKAITPIRTADDYGRSLVIQNDEKIVVGGLSYNGYYFDFALVRYNTNGSIDKNFGIDGKVITSIGIHDFKAEVSIAIQNDGKILMAGESDDSIVLIRYNINGSLDKDFGLNGKVFTKIGSVNNVGKSVAIQKDGKIVVAGFSEDDLDAGYGFALIRYNTNGSLDKTFSSDGKVITYVDSNDFGYSVTIQKDGKIVVAGLSNSGDKLSTAVVRYNK